MGMWVSSTSLPFSLSWLEAPHSAAFQGLPWGAARPPCPPRLWTPPRHPAVLLVAEPLPLSSWPVAGGPCFSGAAGRGVTWGRPGDAGDAGEAGLPPV